MPPQEKKRKTYAVEVLPNAAKDIEKIEEATRKLILDKIEALADDPRPDGSEAVTALRAERVRRFRVGDYRVLYQVFDDRLVVTVVRVGNRNEVYSDKFIANLRRSLRLR